MNRQRSDFIIRFDPKLFNQLSKLKDDFWFDVQQQSGFSTIPGHVPTVRKNMINVRTNMNLLEGYSSASAKMKIDRTRGILQMFQLSLIGMNGGAAKIMEQGGFSRSNLFDCGFMASRASLVRIGMRLLDHRDELNLVAVRRKGIIFLHEIPTPENYGSALENEYVGHRFRQIMTIPSDEDPRRVTSFEDEHFGIQKLTFGNINVLCRSVVDCITDEISYEYIELKTHRDKSAGSPFNVGWMKSIRWWLQMTLTGVKNVVVGVRDVDNILRETLFATSESFLPSDFNKMAVLVFIERCLARIEDCMVKIPEGKAMRFHSPRHSSGLVAVASDHDYNMFHPIFEKLLAH